MNIYSEVPKVSILDQGQTGSPSIWWTASTAKRYWISNKVIDVVIVNPHNDKSG